MFVSLRGMSMRSIATSLWDQQEIRRGFLDKWVYSDIVVTWFFDDLIIRVKMNAMSLQLPDSLKSEIADATENVGYKILKWMRFVYIRIGNDVKYAFPHHAFWTPQGSVDGPKLFKALLKDKSIKATKYSLQLAGELCMENEMVSLYNELPEKNDRLPIISEATLNSHEFMFNQMRNNLGDFKLSYRSNFFDLEIKLEVLRDSIRDANLPAVKYFWNTFSEDDKFKTIMEMVMLKLVLSMFSVFPITQCQRSYKYIESGDNDNIADIFIYFLSGISVEKRIYVLHKLLQQEREKYLIKSFLFRTYPWKSFLKLASIRR